MSSRKLTHVDDAGSAMMVDVGDKSVTSRVATASSVIRVGAQVGELIRTNSIKKGDVLTVAKLAGICAAKKTSDLIPLCHNIALSCVDVRAQLDETGTNVLITATAKCEGKTGVEMEALTAATVAALAVYDMCKAVSHDIVITEVKLEHKSGGTRGEYVRRG